MIKFNEKTTVINGGDIKILSPVYEFLKNNDSYIGNFQRMSVLPTQGSKNYVKNERTTTTTTTTTTNELVRHATLPGKKRCF